MLDAVDCQVLGAVAENPVSSLEVIGKAANLSPSGVAKRIRSLVARGILFTKFVEAQVSYPAVDLDLQVVFVESSPSAWKLVEESCNMHPYTTYRVRCLGAVNGFFLNFAIPHGTTSTLIRFLDGLKEIEAVDNYSAKMPIAQPNYSENNTRDYNPSTREWNFDWKAWGAKIPEYSQRLDEPQPSVLHDLDLADMKILRSLSIDAREEKKVICEKVGVRDYDLSRRLEFYERNRVIRHHKVINERSILGLVSEVILRCRASLKVTEALAGAMATQPFQSTFYPMEEGFVLAMNIPSPSLTTLVTIMQQYCESVETIWCDYTSSLRYYFDNEPSNYIPPSSWNADRDYMLESVLQKVRASSLQGKQG